jgi:hypothetical protein
MTGTKVARMQGIKKVLIPEAVLNVRPKPMIRQARLLVLTIFPFDPFQGVFGGTSCTKKALAKLVPKWAAE